MVKSVRLGGCDILELGIILRYGIETFGGRLGHVARRMINTIVDDGKVRAPPIELLPLSLAPQCPETGRVTRALHPGATLSDVRRDFSNSIRAAGLRAWLFICVVSLNTMALGYSSANRFDPCREDLMNPAQLEALNLLMRDVEIFCMDADVKVPEMDWRALSRAVKLGYSGDVILKGQDITWARIEPALPPPGLAGRVDALALAAPPLRPWLRDPWLCAKPRDQWPARFRKAKVRCSDGEWQRVCEGLYARGIIDFLPARDLIWHHGEPLLNGVFGVPKGEVGSPGFDPLTCWLRLIIQAMPTNEVQNPLIAEIEDLPLFTLWMLLELLPKEQYLVSSEDQLCSFYLYYLPKEWLPWFVLGKERTAPISGVPESHTWPAVRVPAMGWRSAANLFQHLHSQLARAAALRLPSVDLPSWLGRTTTPAALDELGRIVNFIQIYLDNWDKGRLVRALDASKLAGEIGPLQRALREVFYEWGVSRSEKKAVVERDRAATLGADFLGELGRARPTTLKACKVVAWCWHAFGDELFDEQVLGAVLGQLCFFCQYRRPTFATLYHAWYATSESAARPPWRWVIEELLGIMALLPLMQIDFRQGVSEVVSCSDASEQGGAVCIARSLSEQGEEALMRRLAAIPGLFDKSIGLLESFAGIASTRVAFHLLGIRPVLHLASEVLWHCVDTTQHNWPDCVQLGPIEGVDRHMLREHAHRCPTVELFLHTAGSPCPGLCAWNPFRLRGEHSQHVQSEQLFTHVRRVTKELEAAFEGVTVHEMEENVCTMTGDQRDILSDELGWEPFRMGLCQLSEQRRWRYIWCSFPLLEREQLALEQRNGYINVTLRPQQRQPRAAWLRSGWKVSSQHTEFPTVTRPCPVRVPRWKTPGVDRASSFALREWRRDRHRRPPIHYESKCYLTKASSGARRRKLIDEDERLHFFPRDYTYHCVNSKERRRDPERWSDLRGAQIGNCFSPAIVAIVVADLLWHIGWLEQPLDLNELVVERVRLLPVAERQPPGFPHALPSGATPEQLLMRLIRQLLTHQHARGGEIRVVNCHSQSRRVWQEIPAEWFVWETVLSVPWRSEDSHINVCEARAFNLCVRWRSREPRRLNRRFINLLDSQVNLAAVSKGRSASHRLRHVQLKTNAVLLAAHLRDVEGYTRSFRNPADAGSRDIKGWERHRRARRQQQQQHPAPARASPQPSSASSRRRPAARAAP